jgi:endonuclease/exonuclease/phosphatase family metal-dependent hydrolase
MAIRVVSYNLMTGGVGRADPLAEVLLAQRADVIGLQEADDVAVLRRLSWRLGMDFVRADCAGGAVALFSRYAIADSVNAGLLRGSVSPSLRATLRIDGRPVTVDVIDLRSADAVELADDGVAIARLVSNSVEGMPHPTKGNPPRFINQIWPGPEVRVIDHWIERDRLATYASDHYPVGAVIEAATT